MSSSVITTKTSAIYDKQADLIRLEIFPGSRILKPGPGQHYYLYQPLNLRGWENHPFTLGAYKTIRNADTIESVTGQQDHALVDKEIQDVSTSPSSATSSEVSPAASQHEGTPFPNATGQQKLIFFVRPFSSWTRRLREECLKSASGIITPRFFIEGPYGERSPLTTYENVVFIVGGTGIAGALPYILEHIKTTANAEAIGNNGRLWTRTTNITLIWSAKQSALIRNIAAHELAPALGREDIQVHLHSTSHKEKTSTQDVGSREVIVADLDSKATTATTNSTVALEILYGRPNIRETILELVDNVDSAGAAGGKIAILTCGPAGMADEARAAVHVALKQGRRGVDYIEETFG